MKTTLRTDNVYFSVKGQMVIPRWLRKEYHIEEGTRAVVYPEGDHIIVKPVTARFIRNLRGSLKGSKAMDILMEERRREREL
ncbi:MAG: AbrB/MazE/SpoVT family DNA-binding domain-containing protein [Kiritimatiellia bacterium]|nr:AbrB/MazE/SpoVT family DNA-binding domain-containing protein [Kiritimatiellia bacterium]